MGRLLVIPLALLLLLAGAMAWSGTAAEPPADFRFINRGEIKTLDPNRMSWMQDIRIGLALWEGLYQLDPTTMSPSLGSAGRVDVSDDKLVYTFHIRPEARWSNGDPLAAKDFVFAWRRMLEEPGDYTSLLYYVRGAQAYSEAFAAKGQPDFATVGVEAVDAKTLRVSLVNPVPFFPDLCAFPSFFPLHEPSMRPFAEVDPDTKRTTYRKDFTKPPHLVTNGPYRMHAWAYKRRLRLVASDHYWDKGNVRSRVIDQVSADDPFAAFQIYNSGGVDWLAEVHPEIGKALRRQGRDDLRVHGGFGTYFYSFNTLPKLPDGAPNPFHDVRVRRALAMAVDKRPIVENVTGMGETAATTYVPPGIFAGYPSPKGQSYDPDAARRLLAEAGFPGGRGFPRVTLLFNTGAHHDKVAQIVRRQWLDGLGVDVSLEGVEVKVFGERLHNQRYAVARASWIGDYQDVSTFTDKYRSVSENNDAKWSSAAYDDLCAQATREPDPAKRLALLSKAEGILLDEVPIIPMYYYLNTYLHGDHVKGIEPNPKNMQNFKALYVERKG
jgi:oligopeptide transport system substrate-binding protein